MGGAEDSEEEREGQGREKRRGGRRKRRELREVGLVCLLSVRRLLGPGNVVGGSTTDLGYGPNLWRCCHPFPWSFWLTQPPPALLGVEQRRFGAEQPRRAGEEGWAALSWREELSLGALRT